VTEERNSGYHEMKDMKKESRHERDGPGAFGALDSPTHEAAAVHRQKILYRVSQNVKVGLHEGPDPSSAKIGKELAHGDTFEVDETRRWSPPTTKIRILSCIW
jgi:hypothetical protein